MCLEYLSQSVEMTAQRICESIKFEISKSPLRRFSRSGLSGPFCKVGKVPEIRFYNCFNSIAAECSMSLFRLYWEP